MGDAPLKSWFGKLTMTYFCHIKRSLLPFACFFSVHSYNTFLSSFLRRIRPRGPTHSFFCPIPTVRMALKRRTKKKLISDSQLHEKDTGSPQVQIAILTKEIVSLTYHLQDHKKDHSARRGLLGKVAHRRKLLNYLRMNKPTEYQEVLEKHGLK